MPDLHQEIVDALNLRHHQIARYKIVCRHAQDPRGTNRWQPLPKFDREGVLATQIAARRKAEATKRRTPGAGGKSTKSAKANVTKPSREEILEFYARCVNGDGFLPQMGISTSIRHEMLVRGLVTEERLRARGA